MGQNISPAMASVLLLNHAADVIARAQANGQQTPAELAYALESAQLLQSPETAKQLAKHDELRRQYAEAAATVADLVVERGERLKVENALRDRIAELEAAAPEGGED
ncbi:hypothetical protein [Streptomyces antibioticus]|uniref:hypothetical protein n=1 Tax=Streptomyces antibioticus TaxID=1890 RepID=UPI0033BEB70A